MAVSLAEQMVDYSVVPMVATKVESKVGMSVGLLVDKMADCLVAMSAE